MPRLWVRIVLFLSSYAPLLAIYAVLSWIDHRAWALTLLAIAAVSVLGTLAYITVMVSKNWPETKTVHSVQHREGEVLNYIAAYIIPFVSLPFNSWASFIAIAILFLVLGVVYITSNLIVINPVLSLFGYHLLEVTWVGDEDSSLVITRNSHIVHDQPVSLIEIGTGIYIAVARSGTHGSRNSAQDDRDSHRRALRVVDDARSDRV